MTDEIADFMQTISTGVYVIGVCGADRTNAFTASSVMPVSFKPVMVAVAVGTDHASRLLLHAGKAFTINVLRGDQMELAGHFGTVSGRQVNKLASVRWRPGLGGAPILVDTLAYIECELATVVPAGDHELVVGKVVAGQVLSRDAHPLLYRETRNLDGARDLYPSQLRDAAGGAAVRAHPFTVRC
jgi:flavin reductase (DIM6/NTAB) family NADH-FMN oxidoreductase RutF